MGILLPLLFFLIFFSPVFPSDWKVSPIKIELSPNDRTSSTTVYNVGSVPINFQVKAMEWTQDSEGNDVYKDTHDILFFPKIFTLEPGKEKVIRIGIKTLNPIKERAYRLYIEEIPSSVIKEEAVLRIALRIGVPVFVKPLKDDIRWVITKKAVENGTFVLEIQNTGNIHIRINSIKLRGVDAQGREVFSKNIEGWYVLAGARRVFSEKIEDCEKISSLRFEILGIGFKREGELEITNRDCYR